MASQIDGMTIVYSTVCSGADQRKHQSSASLAFVRGIHWWPVNSPHNRPVTWKMFPFDDVIMYHLHRLSVKQYGKCWRSIYELLWNFTEIPRGMRMFYMITRRIQGTIFNHIEGRVWRRMDWILFMNTFQRLGNYILTFPNRNGILLAILAHWDH